MTRSVPLLIALLTLGGGGGRPSCATAPTSPYRRVPLRHEAPVAADLHVLEGGSLRIRFVPRDRDVPRPTVREVWFDPTEGEAIRFTGPDDDLWFVSVGALPDGMLNADDVAGTLRATVDDREYRSRIEPPMFVVDRPEVAAEPGTMAVLLLVAYCGLIVIASLVGGWLPSFVDLTHERMQHAMSLVGGLMLGIGLFHMLPHGVHELGSVDRGVWWMMIGLVSMFLLIRTFHFHQHGPVAHPVEGPLADAHAAAESHDHDHDNSHDHDDSHGHGHAHDDGHSHGHDHSHELSWVGVFIGLSVHTLIDGVALAASVQADVRYGHSGPFFGLGTFLAIVLHKPLDAVSITTLMSAGGWSPPARNLANLAYASMCPLGAIAFAIGVGQLGGAGHLVVGAALAFSAGVFVCISLGDILPEMEFHDHNRVTLTIFLLAGIGLAWLIGFVEPGHAHG